MDMYGVVEELPMLCLASYSYQVLAKHQQLHLKWSLMYIYLAWSEELIST